MNKKNYGLPIFIVIIVILLILTSAIAVKVINDENNNFLINNNYPENSYKVGIVGDTVISISYESGKRSIVVYYYNENNEFTKLRHIIAYQNRVDARKDYNYLYKKSDVNIKELRLQRNSCMYAVDSVDLPEDYKITKNKQDLQNIIREKFNSKGFTEII